MSATPSPPKTRSAVLPSQPQSAPGASLAAGPAAIDDLRGELQGWFELSPQGQMVFDEAGVVLRHNAALDQMLGTMPVQLRDAAPELRLLLGWPSELPAVAATRTHDGWLAGPAGEPVRVRVRVRGVPASTGGRMPGSVPSRWIALVEDRNLEDERDIARVEIQALMGTAGIGVATWDAARGWVGSVQRGARPASPDGSLTNADGEHQGSLMAVGRDLVEPESMADYERLQTALRTRSRIEVRYAVRHRESGRRWLMTRVEPAELGPQRGAFSVVTVDVTEEETARRRNHDLLTELTTILDVSPAGIAYLRGDQLVRCNRRFETLLSGSTAYAPGESFDAVLTRAGLAADTVAQVMRAVRGAATLETELFLPSGTQRPAPIWCSLALRRTHETTPGAVGLVVVLADATRLKSQQSELEALARERELMFNLSDVGIVYQRDGRIERANQAMADLIGQSPEVLKGSPMSRLYETERAWQRYVELETHDMSTLGRSHGERRVRRNDGSLFWAQVSQRPVASDRPSAGTIMSFVNIDDRQRARESLVQQADRTRAILDSVLVGIVTVGDTGIEWMNRSARRMFGGELGDFVGAPISVVANDELDHPLRRMDYFETLEEGQAETFECRLRARDGRHFWVVGNVVVTGQATANRQLTYALLDIERRRQAEVSIVQARASLQRIIETAPLAIALFDAASQQVLQLNQMAATFAGRPMGEIVGRVPAQWLPGPEGAKLSADLHRALATPDSVQRELRRGPAEGVAGGIGGSGVGGAAGGEGALDAVQRVWDIRIVSLRSAADAPDQLLMVASDVTAQRAADEARLAAAIAQREMLIKEVHHRIKNNLQGVAGLLQQSASRHPEAAGAIAEAVSQVHAIAQVHGLQVGVTGPMRVRGVVEAIAASVQRMFGRNISVEVSGPAPHRFALSEADSIPIALTVNELLTNAIKHSAGVAGSAAGDIRCHVVCREASVAIAIANRGALAPGFSLAAVPAGVSGLGLVRSLLPRKGARMSLSAEGPDVVAWLELDPPAVTVLEPIWNKPDATGRRWSLLNSPARNLVGGLLFLAVVVPLAVIGYMLLGWSFGDALYMVVITIFTVGYDEVRPIDTPELRALTLSLVVLGCTAIIYLTGALVQFFTLSQIQQALGIKRMNNEIDRLHGHVIVCGFGRIGNMLSRELKAGRARFVVLERSEKRVAEARALGYLCIQGEATDEDVLKAAGVDRAAILTTVLPDDAANVFITLSARSLNKTMRIIARGELPATESKLLHAGADQVVLPAHIGAERIAELVLYEDSAKMIRGSDAMRGLEHDLLGLGLQLEVVPAAEGSPFTGKTIEAVETSAHGAFLIIALNRRDGSTLKRPPPETRIMAGDGVVVLGRSGRVRALDAFSGL